MPAAAGTVVSLYRWPVKSMAGEPVDALRIDSRGAGGDRAQALFDVFARERRRLTVRQLPRMLSWSAAYPQAPGAALDPEAPPLPVLTAPDGRRFDWDDPALQRALSDDLGRDVTLERDLALMPDAPDTLLVTVEASRAGLESELGRAVELRRFRPNLHLRLDAPAFAEEGWAGRRLRVGEAELELLEPCERCVIPTRDPDTREKWPELLRHLARAHDTLFGIYARALQPATVRVGDAVAVA
jgi:MOSC domain-containing protein